MGKENTVSNFWRISRGLRGKAGGCLNVCNRSKTNRLKWCEISKVLTTWGNSPTSHHPKTEPQRMATVAAPYFLCVHLGVN